MFTWGRTQYGKVGTTVKCSSLVTDQPQSESCIKRSLMLQPIIMTKQLKNITHSHVTALLASANERRGGCRDLNTAVMEVSMKAAY